MLWLLELPTDSALFILPFSDDCESLKRIFNKYVRQTEKIAASASQPAPGLTVVNAAGRHFLGPWPSLADRLRFDPSQASRYKSEFKSQFADIEGMSCISAAGLVAVCAAHGHSDHLMLLCQETDSYTCPFRFFLRLVQQPSTDRKDTLFSSLHMVGSWFGEQSLLSLFGAESRDDPEALVHSVINNAANAREVR